MRTIRVVAAVLAIVTILSPTLADEALFGRTLSTPPAGQPVCRDVNSLKAYLTAMIGQDKDRRYNVSGCSMIGPGKEVVVTEDVPANSEAMHVVRLRVFGVPAAKAIGYSVSSGLQGHR